MGLLVEGQWQDRWYDTKKSDGRFVRSEAKFRNWVTADGAPGPSGEGGFEAAAGRYRLYVSYACPWAHRTLIVRALKDLEPMIDVSVVHSFMGSSGWSFEAGPKVVPDPDGARFMHEVYTRAAPDFTGRVTVPVLWDTERRTIVSNESSEIIRMLEAFDAVGAKPVDLYPEALRAEIDEINAEVYAKVNNGVYRAGFATTQEAYEEAVHALFDALDALEARLSTQRYLVGNQITEADWRLFTTLVRFDAVYVGHFKCNLRRILDYPNLSGYLRDLYQVPKVAQTVHMDHIKAHYYRSHETVNPTRIVPAGPALEFESAHDRARFG